MRPKTQRDQQNKKGIRPSSAKPKAQESLAAAAKPPLSTLLQQAAIDPGWLMPQDVQHLQRTIGNQAVGQLFGGMVQPQPVLGREPVSAAAAGSLQRLLADRSHLLVQAKPEPLAAVAAGQFMVEDAQSPGEGQIQKSEFLAHLQEEIRQMADEVLAQIGQSSKSCPYIPYWFNYYEGKDVAHIEKSLRRYVPAVMQAPDWQTCLRLITERVRQGLEAHVDTGSLEGVPAEVPQDLHDKEGSREETAVMKMPTTAVQRCGCKDKGTREDQRLLSSRDQRRQQSYKGPSLTPFSLPDSYKSLKWGQEKDFSNDWTDRGKKLQDKYDILHQVKGGNIRVVAVGAKDMKGRRKVVATSSLTYKTKEDVIWFTSFGSTPPFSGLGSVVLQLLEEVANGRRIEPDVPVAGSYTFYNKKGYGNFKIPRKMEETIKQGIKERYQALVMQGMDLEDPSTIEALEDIQKWVKEKEGDYIMRGKIRYLGENV